MFDQNKNFIESNQAGLDLLGYSREELLSMSMSDVDADPTIVLPAHKQLLSGKKIVNYEHQLKRKDGKIITVLNNSKPLTDTNGNVIGMQSTLIDITLQKQAQEKLQKEHDNREDTLRKEKEKLDRQVKEQTIKLVKKNEELSRLITDRELSIDALTFSHRVLEISNKHIQMTPLLKEYVHEFEKFTGCDSIGIRVLDNNGNIPYEAYKGFSDSFYKTESPLSIKSDQCMCVNVVKGETDPNLPFYTEGGSFYMNGTTRFLATVSEEYKGSTRNTCNQVGYESVALIPIHMGSNNLGLIHLADHRDNMVPLEKVRLVEGAAKQLAMAMKRIVSEEALRVSKEKYRSLVETSSDWIWEVDQDGVYTYASPKIKDILGYEPADFIGKRPFDFMSADEAKRTREIYMDRSAAMKPFSGLENINIHKDGRKVVLETSGVPIIGSDGNLLGYRGIDRDVTENKYLQDQVIRSERLAATGQLASSIAHEINSPLQAVTVLLSTMKEQYNDNNELIKNFDLLKGAYTSIRDTVKNLMDLNRPGKEQKQPTNPNNIIKKTVDLIQAHLKQNKIKINLDLSSKIPAIQASPQQLNHLFLNLINNSIEALTGTSQPKDGWMNSTSDIGRIDIKTKLRNENIIIEISDNGPGILEKDLLHIFDPFYTTKKEMGLGVGLSICHDIIKDLHGNIVTENSHNGGAVLTITIPFEQPQGNQDKT